jgi:AcrR family transcriptional regulator
MAVCALSLGRGKRKQQQTRRAIAAAGFEMFAEHDFDALTAAGVARRANASEVTCSTTSPPGKT